MVYKSKERETDRCLLELAPPDQSFNTGHSSDMAKCVCIFKDSSLQIKLSSRAVIAVYPMKNECIRLCASSLNGYLNHHFLSCPFYDSVRLK